MGLGLWEAYCGHTLSDEKPTEYFHDHKRAWDDYTKAGINLTMSKLTSFLFKHVVDDWKSVPSEVIKLRVSGIHKNDLTKIGEYNYSSMRGLCASSNHQEYLGIFLTKINLFGSGTKNLGQSMYSLHISCW